MTQLPSSAHSAEGLASRSGQKAITARAVLAAAMLAVLPACGGPFEAGTVQTNVDGGNGGGGQGGTGAGGESQGGKGGQGGTGGMPVCGLSVTKDEAAVSGGYVTPGMSKKMLCLNVSTQNCPQTVSKVVAREIYGIYGSASGILATGFVDANGQMVQQNVTGQDVPGQYVEINFDNLDLTVPADTTVQVCTGGVVKNDVVSGQSEHMEIPEGGVVTDPANNYGPFDGSTIGVN